MLGAKPAGLQVRPKCGERAAGHRGDVQVRFKKLPAVTFSGNASGCRGSESGSLALRLAGRSLVEGAYPRTARPSKAAAAAAKCPPAGPGPLANWPNLNANGGPDPAPPGRLE